MSVNLRYPNINAGSAQEQISQIKSYLHQLVEQLNYALPSMGDGGSQTYEVQGAEVSYYELRSLIMQNMHEIQTTFEKLSEELKKEFVKSSGWEGGKILATDEEGNVIAIDRSAISVTTDE